MESVLEIYQHRYHPDFPVLCLDEALKQLVKETVHPLAPQPGQPRQADYQYERSGAANLFMVYDPMVGWRHVDVTRHRTAVDYAHLLKDIVDSHYLDAWLITVVQDNLNTHKPSSLYKAFEPAEARCINRLEFCYTPQHGSWLNMAEIELSLLARQYLDRRIAEFETLQTEVAAWA